MAKSEARKGMYQKLTAGGEENPQQRAYIDDQQQPQLTFWQKSLLTVLLTGNDSAGAFNKMFNVPLLQTLGVPVAVVSMYSIVAGPLAMLLIPLTGYLTDKGTRHRQKKMMAVVVNSVVFLSGIAMITAANLLFMSQGIQTTHEKTNKTLFGETETGPYHPNDTSDSELGLFSMPTTAVLGLVGFILFDVGNGCNISAVRACVLACSPRQDHTSLLTHALGMAALGGCITCVLGLVDLSPVLKMGTSEGSLVAQSTVQLLVCATLIIVGTISTVAASYFGAKRLDSTHYLPLPIEDAAHSYGTFATESQVRTGANHEGDGRTKGEDTDKNAEQGNTSNEQLSDDTYGEMETTNLILSNAAAPSISGEKQLLTHSKVRTTTVPSRDPYKRRRVLNFVLACLSLFLASSVMYSYNVYVSDFIGKEVYGGDPTAPAGSPELEAYEDGVSLSGSGLLVVYCCYFVVSMIQDRLLRLVGPKVSFCLSNILMAAAVLTLTFTKNMAIYYVTCVLFGAQRSAMMTVPYVLANQYSQEASTGGAVKMGKAMALMTCMIPLNCCTIYLLSGPLIALTGYDAAPLLVASACALLGSVIFTLHGLF